MEQVLIVLADGFEEIEALGTADVLKRCNVPVTLAGLNDVSVTGSHGIKVTAEVVFKDADLAKFGALVLPGGLPGATNLYSDDAVIEALKAFAAAGKITAAICAAPMVLDKAGLLDGKKFTMYPAEDLYKFLSDSKRPASDLAVTDGKVITGKGPGATPKFAAAIAEALGVKNQTTAAVLQGMFF